MNFRSKIVEETEASVTLSPAQTARTNCTGWVRNRRNLNGCFQRRVNTPNRADPAFAVLNKGTAP